MRRFEAVLRRIGARLELPHPARSRVLHEIASDLEAAYGAYRTRGLDEEEAARRAERLLDPSWAALEALERVHAPLYRRWLARFSQRTRHRAERAVLVVLAVTVLAGGVAGLVGAEVLRDPSPFLWPVLGLGAAALALGVGKAFLLYVKRDHSPRRLRGGLSALLVLGSAILTVGAVGVVIDAYRLAGAVVGAVESQVPLTLRWIRQDGTLLVVSLLLALALALVWFVCLRRAIAIEHAEAEIFGP